MGKQVLVEVWQDGRIEAYVVFHEQYTFHARLLSVVLYVHLVLYQLYDGEDKVGIAQPAEHILEDAQVHVLHTPADAVREWSKHHARCSGRHLLHGVRHVEGVVVNVARHTDDEVVLRYRESLVSLLYR